MFFESTITLSSQHALGGPFLCPTCCGDECTRSYLVWSNRVPKYYQVLLLMPALLFVCITWQYKILKAYSGFYFNRTFTLPIWMPHLPFHFLLMHDLYSLFKNLIYWGRLSSSEKYRDRYCGITSREQGPGY